MVWEYNHKLKEKLEELGISQRYLAIAAGIPEAHMSMAMRGKYILSEQKRDRIAEILCCAVSDIF
jgi:transcriptional regulator with XRE-family HTH domain